MIFVLKPVAYLFSHFFKRDTNVIVFGAWFGKRYSDNSKYLFEYMHHESNFNCFWATKDQAIMDKLTLEGYNVLRSGSWRSLKIHLKAKFFLVSSGKVDVDSFLCGGGTFINLWHGAPLKKIFFEDKKHFNPISWKFKSWFFPYLDELSVDYVLNTSPVFEDILVKSFQISKSRVLPLGYPRNDILLNNTNNRRSLKIGYFPTFRDANREFNPFDTIYGFDLMRWNSVISMFRLEWHTNFHFASNKIELPDGIKVLKNDSFFDLNEHLNQYDIIITDYSGCYWDSLLLNSETILFWPDYDDYILFSRDLNFSKEKLPSKQCHTWDKLLDFVEEYYTNSREQHSIDKEPYNSFNSGESRIDLMKFVESLVECD